MTKKTLLSVLLLVTAIILVLSAAAGCSRPKPEPKQTPTAEAVDVQPTNTLQTAPTQVVPTVMTTNPTVIIPAGTSEPGAPASEATPTPVVIAPAGTAAAPSGSDEGGSSEWFLYTLRWGDTLFSLAARYDTTVEAISALNNITQPDQIETGMQIKIPRGGTATGGTGGTPGTGSSVEYVVQAGDDLHAIAVKFGVSAQAIIDANGISDPNFIFVGQKLVIPSDGSSTPSGGTSGGSGVVHVVKPGESLDMIAAMYGTTSEAIAEANELVNPNWIYVGQSLMIP